ncbi:hypothetical protein ACLD43_04970 [Clostridium botulinum]|uniref:Uncharacterized protein n=1 Tax=Clostridium botulinum TaxID=1491 RepID=A0A846J9N1_CLOBO|nr:hypothetical protein [Clostridium botulinum]ACA53722.1 hypothetical protein CLK_0825 [Clostridium botulinum A3 str. Loch Maree]NFH67354.1 hypothetical protein [Clostridium botulinum]NFJ10579.1 hypothetical protein [Clostridium botulinum]NFK15594.1 hypothetical protein [Clostridium botulinum]NFM95463.1 hypothetical protein [Clostridium botulinum]
MKKANKALVIGIFIIAITTSLRHFTIQLPEFVLGLGYGVGIALELIGLYSINHDISKLQNCKRNFIKKCLNK